MHELIIIGAGPAGLSAAINAAENDVDVMVIDEFFKPGGRLLGQLNEQPDGTWWNGLEEAAELFDKAREKNVAFHFETSVFQIDKQSNGWSVRTNKGDFQSESLLVATGAAERSIPIPGWTLPGVMTIGAAQVMANVHQVKPGRKGMIIGANVLSFAIARELQLSGVELAGIVLPPHRLLSKDSGNPGKVFHQLLSLSHLAPSPLFKWGGALAGHFAFIEKMAVRLYPKRGLKIWGIPLQIRKAVTEIIGKDRVEAVRLSSISPSGEILPGHDETVKIDFVCIAGGLYPLVELLGILDCPFKYIPSLGGYVPVHREDMRTPIPSLYVAGNITGIESSKVAIVQGKIAGLSAAMDIKRKDLSQAIRSMMALLHETRRQAVIQFHPDILKGREEMNKAASQEEMNRIPKPTETQVSKSI
ncbi:FAD-binding protein [Sporolactobacillus sp. THM7-7]|nr:FAD-binding protein [Sporolactobacillus sp. THM7-7]